MQSQLPQTEDLKDKLFKKSDIELSDQNKSPLLFRWKTAALVIGSISAILLIITLIVVYQINSDTGIKENLTFISDIADKTSILTGKKQLLNLNNNFKQIYGTTMFQKAKFLGKLTHFDQDNLRFDIFYEENQKLLFIFEIDSEIEKESKFAMFMNSPFPVPKGNDFNKNITYYSFELNDQRKSSLISLYDKQTLKLYPRSSVKSALDCKTYNFQTNQQLGVSIRFLSDSILFDLQNLDIKVNSDNYHCFSPELTKEQFTNRLTKIIGIDYRTTDLKFKSVQVYFLQ